MATHAFSRDIRADLAGHSGGFSTAEMGTRSILTPRSGAIVSPEDEGLFATAIAGALALKKDDPRRAQSRAHAETWASRALARRPAEFHEKVRARTAEPLAHKGRGPEGTPFGSGA